MIDEKILNDTKLEIEGALSEGDDYINAINKEMAINLANIYNAVTEIKLNDEETYKKVKNLVLKQECYKELKNKYINESIRNNCVRK